MKPILLCLALLPGIAHAAAPAADADAAFYDAAVQQAFEHYRLPGLAVGVIEDGAGVGIP